MLFCLPVLHGYICSFIFTFNLAIISGISFACSYEVSRAWDSGYRGSEKYIPLIACPKSELNEFQLHAGFIYMRQREPSCSGDTLCPKHTTNQLPQSVHCVAFGLDEGTATQTAGYSMSFCSEHPLSSVPKEGTACGQVVCDFINKTLYPSTYVPGVLIKFSQAAWGWVLSSFWMF